MISNRQHAYRRIENVHRNRNVRNIRMCFCTEIIQHLQQKYPKGVGTNTRIYYR